MGWACLRIIRRIISASPREGRGVRHNRSHLPYSVIVQMRKVSTSLSDKIDFPKYSMTKCIDMPALRCESLRIRLE